MQPKQFALYLAYASIWSLTGLLNITMATYLFLNLPLSYSILEFLLSQLRLSQIFHASFGALVGLYSYYNHGNHLFFNFKEKSASFLTLWFILTLLASFFTIIYTLAVQALQTDMIYRYLTPPSIVPFLLFALVISTIITLACMVLKRWTYREPSKENKVTLFSQLMHGLSTVFSIASIGAAIGMGLYVCHTLFLDSNMIYPIIIAHLSPLTSLMVLGASCGVLMALILLILAPNAITPPNTLDFKQVYDDFYTTLTTMVWSSFVYGGLGMLYLHAMNMMLLSTSMIPYIATHLIQTILFGGWVGSTQGMALCAATPIKPVKNILQKKTLPKRANQTATDAMPPTPSVTV